MKIAKYLIPLCLLAATGLSSCEKDDSSGDGGSRPEAIGTYSYDNKQYDIVYGQVSESESTYEFFFSPQDGNKGAVNTYFIVAIKKYFVGEVLNTDDVFHNDEYMFVYEDPDHLYSQFKKVHGEILVVKKANNKFVVELDFALADQKPFKASFEGVLPTAQ